MNTLARLMNKNNRTLLLVVVCLVLCVLVIYQNKNERFQGANNNVALDIDNSKLVKIPELCLGDTCLTEKNLHHMKCKAVHWIYNPIGNRYRRYGSDKLPTRNYHDNNYRHGWLHSEFGWHAKNDNARDILGTDDVTRHNPYMQISSPKLLTVGGIALQSRRNGHNFVKSYQVKYAVNTDENGNLIYKEKNDYKDEDFKFVDNGREFHTDLGKEYHYWRNLERNFFNIPVKCYAIRIYPFKVYLNVGMRAGLIVCGEKELEYKWTRKEDKFWAGQSVFGRDIKEEGQTDILPCSVGIQDNDVEETISSGFKNIDINKRVCVSNENCRKLCKAHPNCQAISMYDGEAHDGNCWGWKSNQGQVIDKRDKHDTYTEILEGKALVDNL